MVYLAYVIQGSVSELVTVVRLSGRCLFTCILIGV